MNLFSSLTVPKIPRRRWLSEGNALRATLLAILALTLAIAPRAIADDIGADAEMPEMSFSSDDGSVPPNQVLEIPQQCDQASVAVLCDRSAETASTASTAADASAVAPDDDTIDPSQVVNNPDLGSVYDYANQNITNESSAAGTVYLPMGAYVPGYPAMSPGPTVVYSGPGAYQQWAGGPGTYQQLAPGPGYTAPQPLGYHPYGAFGGGFGPHLLGGLSGHLGHR